MSKMQARLDFEPEIVKAEEADDIINYYRYDSKIDENGNITMKKIEEKINISKQLRDTSESLNFEDMQQKIFELKEKEL